MALRVWLPLNGSLENIGISDITVTNSGATVNTAGKIGSCYSFDGSDDYISLNSSILYSLFKGGTQQFSVAFWAYHADATRAIVFGDYGLSGAINFNIEFTTDHKIRFYWAGSPDKNFSTTFPVSTWTHITLTYDGSKVNLYINGTLSSDSYSGTLATKNKTSGVYYLGRDSRTGTTVLNGKLNDFRIYDHCLSALEVKEIAQGLVLHYKLDGFNGGVGDNLAFGTNTANTSTNTWRLSLQTGGTSNSIEYDGDTPVAVITRNDVAHSGWAYLHYDNIHAADIKPSTTYTISFDVKTSVDGNITFTGLCQGNATNYKTKSTSVIQGVCTANQWCHIIVQCITKDDFTDLNNNQVIYLNTSASLRDTNVTLKMKNMKMEEGSIATAWTPASSELGIDASTVPDSSGYNNNGTITGNLSWISSNLGRYNTTLLHPDDCSCYISRPHLNFLGNSGFTFSCWVRPTNYSRTSSGTTNTGYQFIMSQGRDYRSDSSVTYGASITMTNGTPVLYFGNGTLSSNTQIALNTWAHIVGTYDGATKKIYVNGILKNSTAETNIEWSQSGNRFVVGKMSYGYTVTNAYFPFVGDISDVRVYATALSADDILDLYHTPANVNNLGGLHSFQLNEKNGNALTASPIVAGSGSTVTWDETNHYYIITSPTSTSTWGIGPAVGTNPKKIIPWGATYRFTCEVYIPVAVTFAFDYNNNDVNTSLSGNDNDATGMRLSSTPSIPANTWTVVTFGSSNTNETKNPNHLPLYDYSSGIGPRMDAQSSAITWYLRNPQWYLIDSDNTTNYQVYQNGILQGNIFKEDKQNDFASMRNQEKAIWATNFIEK